MSASMIRRRVVVHGEVQGVWFREATRSEAVAAGVGGWVRNRPEGTVEAVFEGGRDAVARLVAFCHAGPAAATVRRVDVVQEPPENSRGFDIL